VFRATKEDIFEDGEALRVLKEFPTSGDAEVATVGREMVEPGVDDEDVLLTKILESKCFLLTQGSLLDLKRMLGCIWEYSNNHRTTHNACKTTPQ